MPRGVLVLWCACLVYGQPQRPPDELLKEAIGFHQQGKLDDAIRDYDLFLDMYPDNPGVRSNLGAALAAKGNYARAIEEYKLALLKMQDPQIRLNLALAYYKSADYRDAAQELETVHAGDASNRQATILLADCKLHTGDYKAAIGLLDPLHAAQPDDAGVDYILGSALARDGQAEAAQRVINPLLSGPDSAEKRLLLGTTKFAAHDFAGARQDLRAAVEMKSDLPDVNSYYGMALFSSGQTVESRAYFEKELKQNPNDFESNLHLGMMLRVDDQKYAEALQYLNRALAARPGDLAVRYQVALVKMAQGKQDAARMELEDIVRQAPTFTEAHVSLATVYFRENRKEDGNRERAIVRKLTDEQQARQGKPQTNQ
ncbi:MAG TPA: tetratricopeptide repeat protein [Bryobacteraceae bacterium]|nr:tetratricopeptide repeat protein [Bryobacteraceae bacterium]